MYRFETMSVLVKSYMYILAGMLLTTTLVFIFVSLPEKRILHTGIQTKAKLDTLTEGISIECQAVGIQFMPDVLSGLIWVQSVCKEIWHKEQAQRVQHLRDACTDKTLLQNEPNVKVQYRKFYFSKKYNFNYCKVPKVGSTFLTQTLTLLERDDSARENVYKKPKGKSHSQADLELSRFPQGAADNRKSRSVLVTRDPYTRLFSEFIDTMTVPSTFYITAMEIVKSQRNRSKDIFMCANDITFQEFLNSIVDDVRNGKPLNNHWAPITSLCLPCELNILALVKQESFSTDVVYALKNVGVSGKKFDLIYQGLETKKTEYSILNNALGKMNCTGTPSACMTEFEKARRLWIEAQIQGVIDDKIMFPADLFDTEEKAHNGTYLAEVILRTSQQHPLTSEESSNQRRKALVKAYATISESTIRDIQRIFKQDFILFDYSDKRPT